MTDSYATKEAFEVYVKYLALKQHFNSDSYDYHKFNGKTKASFESFRARKDVFRFYKLSKMDDWFGIILSNIIKNKSAWIGDIINQDGKLIYTQWLANKENLSYNFSVEVGKLLDDYPSNFKVVNGQLPYIISKYLCKEISLECLSLLIDFAGVEKYWYENISDKVIAPDIISTASKYRPFIDVDEKKFKNIVKKRFS